MASDPNGWPDPTPDMLEHPLFNAIWRTIKRWDVNVPGAYSGYCGATGNHARAIFDAVSVKVAAAVQAEREACLRLIDQHQSVAREVIGRNPENREAVGGVWATAECASAIRARGDTAALDAALARARREGMEAAAALIAKHRFKCEFFPAERSRGVPMLSPGDFKSQATAAIRAAAGEAGE